MKIDMYPARFELATFRVWGGRDNYYTTETTMSMILNFFPSCLAIGQKTNRFIPLFL